ncbi:MAG: ABC transporter ATP-binding protein [Actinobacteria bacterium]|nr:MAG: ABC transporter ATP-binding protein [Actinomycetota bacterium]
MPEALVRAVSMERAYGVGSAQVKAVTDATFSVEAGDSVALLGPSGSGKSTLLHLIAGLDAPTSGSIEWPILGRREDLRPGPVGVAFQGPSLLPPLTVVENVALPMILAGADEERATAGARDLLDVFEVDIVANKLPEELSGGQSERVGIARAFSGSPRLVLADEPTGQQDRSTGGRLLEAIVTLAVLGGAALVVATHDAAVAERLTARWTMRDGALRTRELTCSS